MRTATDLLTSLPPFVNEEFLDFSDVGNRGAMEAALGEVRGLLGRDYAMVVGGRRVGTAGRLVSVNPARPAEVVGIHPAVRSADRQS